MRFLRRKINKKRKAYRNPLQVIAIGFSIIILVGAFLLMLPISSKSGEMTPFIDALFTATTSTCVTGLVVVDTYAHWSHFGQLLILIMIQIGGMGFMLVLTAFSLLVGRRITIRERVLIGQSISVDNISGVVKLAKRIIGSVLMVEMCGAAILSVRFVRDFGLGEGIWKGIFVSVSSFCNAGLDLLSQKGGEYCSLTPYRGDFTVTMTISFLIILGGLGFYLWDDVLSARRNGRFSLHTKLVLTTTSILLAAGTVFFLVAEWSNPATLKGEPLWNKVMLAFFQSVTTRTAGLNQLNQASLSPASKVATMLLMFIGGSPGSTAGGVKTVTVTLLFLTAVNTLRGKTTVNVYGRRLSYRYVMDAVTIIMVGVVCVLTGTLLLTMFDGVAFETALFECISAFATVGLSEGITFTLSASSLIVLMALMYLGRVGIITLGLAIIVRGKRESNIKYPEGKIIVG